MTNITVKFLLPNLHLRFTTFRPENHVLCHSTVGRCYRTLLQWQKLTNGDFNKNMSWLSSAW